MQVELQKLVKLDGAGKILVSTKALCQILGVSRTMLTRWNKAGMPKQGTGWWNLADVIAWRDSSSSSAGGGNENVSDAARKLKADADYRELKAEREEIVLEALKGQYIKRDEIVTEWTERVMALKASLLGMPKLIAREFLDVDIAAQVEKKVREYVTEYLTDYARSGKYTPTRKDK